jgi:hypothetical protein
MKATNENIYLVHKAKFEKTGSLGAKAIMEEYAEFAPTKPVALKVEEKVEKKKDILKGFKAEK